MISDNTGEFFSPFFITPMSLLELLASCSLCVDILYIISTHKRRSERSEIGSTYCLRIHADAHSRGELAFVIVAGTEALPTRFPCVIGHQCIGKRG